MKRRANIFSWVGFAIALVAVISYVPFFAVFPATRDFPWANYLIFLVAGAFLAVGLTRAFRDPERYRGKISGSILAALSFLLLALFVLSVTYLSKQIPSARTALGVGQRAPSFLLANSVGRPVSSTDLLKDHRGVLIVFYRGYW